MKPVVLFGAGKIAEVVLYFLRHHSERSVVSCALDQMYIKHQTWCDLPVVAFESLERAYPPEDYDVFIAVGYQELNDFRARKCEQARAKGYTLMSYVDPEVHLPLDCEFGDNCFIMQGSVVQPCVKVGDNVFIWGGALVGHHSVIGDNCWLTSRCNIAGNVVIGDNSFLAMNSSITNGVNVGKRCFIGANALVNKCTDDAQVYLSQPSGLYRLDSNQFLRLSSFN